MGQQMNEYYFNEAKASELVWIKMNSGSVFDLTSWELALITQTQRNQRRYFGIPLQTSKLMTYLGIHLIWLFTNSKPKKKRGF